MENLSQNLAPTPESVWAFMQESNRYLTEKFAETDRQMQKTGRRLEKYLAESEKARKESEKARKESEKARKESEKARLNYERRMKNMEGRVGAWAKSHGSFAEEYFYSSFENDQTNFFGEKFDDIGRNVIYSTKTLIGEFDIVLYNHTTIAIIEVKYKAHANDVEKVLKKAETFRTLCPYYDDYKVYLGLASLCFYDELEQKCKDYGIAIIKQVGDKVMICDKHLKVY